MNLKWQQDRINSLFNYILRGLWPCTIILATIVLFVKYPAWWTAAILLSVIYNVVENYGYTAIIFVTVAGLSQIHSWHTLLELLILITGVVVSVIGYCWNYDRKKDRERIKRAAEPCRHGIIGAIHDLSKCSDCVHDKLMREAEANTRATMEKARQEEVKVRAAAAQQKRYNDLIKKIRLPEYIKSVDPRQFEFIICELFSRMGYKATATAYSGDNGIDGYLEKDGETSILQCKRVMGSVGEPVLRDLYGAMHSTSSNSAIVVTTGSVSRQAKVWADGKPIRIIEFNELRSMLDKYFHESEIVPSEFAVKMNISNVCPRCGNPLRQVPYKHGKDFIGCTGYPSCRYSRPIK